MLVKYPKTLHLPFSKGLQNDDRRLEDEYCFHDKEVVITTKMDGENTTMYKDFVHARSLYQMKHPSQHWIKQYWSSIRYLIPVGFRNTDSFHYNDFQTNVAKAVRANHITTDEHWTKNWRPNEIKRFSEK